MNRQNTNDSGIPFKTLGSRITCRQCSAKSKRTGHQCRAPAMKGRSVCRTHGGLSTGPKTPEGRKRCALAKTLHGAETIAMRKARNQASVRLAILEENGRAAGLLTGNKTPGRKPKLLRSAR